MLQPAAGSGKNATAREWLENAALESLARRVGARYRLGSAEIADLVQEVRIALWKHGLETQTPSSWVAQVTLNKAVDSLRRRARYQANEQILAHIQERPHLDEELRCLLQVSVDRLPGRLREFYQLRYERGLTERAVAVRLGICRASVQWMDRQCRKQFGSDAPSVTKSNVRLPSQKDLVIPR